MTSVFVQKISDDLTHVNDFVNIIAFDDWFTRPSVGQILILLYFPNGIANAPYSVLKSIYASKTFTIRFLINVSKPAIFLSFCYLFS